MPPLYNLMGRSHRVWIPLHRYDRKGRTYAGESDQC